MDNPIDWYYDGIDETRYPTQCVISIFSEFVRKHNIGIEVWGVSFEEKIPIIKSEYLTFDVCESDIKSEYAHISLKMKGNSPEECELRIQFEPDFYFVFIEKNDDGTVSELDYYDDLCDK